MTEKSPRIERLAPDAAGLSRAVELLRQDRLVAFPTETVYGLGADARSGRAVAAIFAAKGRPSFNPLIAHVASATAAQRFVVWSDMAETLAQAFWPGPLTLVLPLAEAHGVSSLTCAGLPTLGVRVPAGQAAQELLAAFDGPIAAPSANPSGRISPTRVEHVLAGLEGRIAAVLDDGPCPVGVESTIVGLAGEQPTLLRPGGVSNAAIEAALDTPLSRPAPQSKLSAPGQMASHYAPGAPVRLNATQARDGEFLIGFGTVAGDLSLSPDGDPNEAAANLFDILHRADAAGRPIAIAPIPETGLGVAINDRLRRAAAPRDV